MNLTQQLAAALSALLAEGLDHSTREQGRRALDAYKSSAEFKREQFEIALRTALANANALCDIVTGLTAFNALNDGDMILLRQARECLAEGADYLNSLIEGEPT